MSKPSTMIYYLPMMALVSKCNDKFDWSNCKLRDIDSVMRHVDEVKEKRFADARHAWANQSVKDVVDKTSGFKCTRCCSIRGDPDRWKDHWGHDKNQTSCRGKILRHHTQARRSLFTPAKVAHGPKDLERILPVRVTIGQFENGEKFCHVDNWCDEKTAHAVLKDQWTGTTIFHEKPDIMKMRHRQESVKPTCPTVGARQCPGDLVRLRKDCKV